MTPATLSASPFSTLPSVDVPHATDAGRVQLGKRQVRPERTGWRDDALARLHQAYGCGHAGSDLVGLFLEYDNGLPVALIEYRPDDTPFLVESHPAIQAVRAVAERAAVPFFIVRHCVGLMRFTVTSIGDPATADRIMTEAEFVTFLYALRRRTVPADVMSDIAESEYVPAGAACPISGRRRLYGYDVPAVDLDLVVMSHDRGLPAGLFEYKCITAKPVRPDHPTIRACRTLADRAGLGFWVVRYARDHSSWTVRPANDMATVSKGREAETFDQPTFFARLRGLANPSLDTASIITLSRRV
jgi:hypothetical protein